MGLKIEFIVQGFATQKRATLIAKEPQLLFDRHKALQLAERWSGMLAGVIVLEQHVDRLNDIYNEPTVIWRAGHLPIELLDQFGEEPEQLKIA